MTKISDDGNGQSIIKWGWFGKAVAGVILICFPAIVAMFWRETRANDRRFSILEASASYQSTRLDELKLTVEKHDEWARRREREISDQMYKEKLLRERSQPSRRHGKTVKDYWGEDEKQ